MSRKINDINVKLAYLTNKSTGPILKTFRPLALEKKPPGLRLRKNEDPCKKELGALLECVSKHNDNSKCAKQFKNLLLCNETKSKDAEEKMKRLLRGEKVDQRYHPKVLEKLLKKYPENETKQAKVIKQNLLTTLPEARIRQVPFNDPGRPFNKRTTKQQE